MNIEIPEHNKPTKINKHFAADLNTRAFCYSVYSGPFATVTSPKSIDREGLGESRTGTRQVYTGDLFTDFDTMHICL